MIAWMLRWRCCAATPLVDAVRQQDVAAVRALLKTGADVNAPEGDGATALHWAVARGAIELVRLLLDAGASADVGQRSRRHAAAPRRRRTATPRSLTLAARTSARMPTPHAPSGVTPLMEAARSGSVEAVRLLLAHGADVNARERSAAADRADVGGLAAAPGHRQGCCSRTAPTCTRAPRRGR